MKPTVAILRANGVVVSNATGKNYNVRAIQAFGEPLAPETKQYTSFLLCVPRSVFITELMPCGGVRIEIGIGLEK